jgi:hypothetical protein
VEFWRAALCCARAQQVILCALAHKVVVANAAALGAESSPANSYIKYNIQSISEKEKEKWLTKN